MIKGIIALLWKFIRTEIIGTIELIFWISIKNNDFYLELWNTAYIRPAIILTLILIPLISAIFEYKQKRKDINQIIKKLKLLK